MTKRFILVYSESTVEPGIKERLHFKHRHDILRMDVHTLRETKKRLILDTWLYHYKSLFLCMETYKTASEQTQEKDRVRMRVYNERMSVYFLRWITASGHLSQLQSATGPLFIKKWFYEIMTPTFGRELPGDTRRRSVDRDRESFIKGAKLIDFDRIYSWICNDRGYCLLRRQSVGQ